MLGTTLPTPLYPLYEARHGFGEFTTTLVYGAYAVGVIAALLLIGSASDTLGRRPMLMGGLAASLASALVFVTDAGLPALFAGRVLSGLSAGVFTGTATVTLVELARASSRTRASILAGAVNMLGLGCGPLLAGAVATALPAPLHLPYVADVLLLVPAAAVLWLLPETVADARAAWPRPRRPGIPRQTRAVFVPAVMVAFAAFATLGLVTAIEPAFLTQLLSVSSPLLAGTAVFAMFAGSAVGQVTLTRLVGRAALPLGCGILLVGLALMATALLAESLALLLAGTIVVGLGQGVSFSAGLAAISAASPAHRRAETVSAFFLLAYIALSIPVVSVGAAAALWGLKPAGVVFIAVMAALTLAALGAIVRLRHRAPDRSVTG